MMSEFRAALQALIQGIESAQFPLEPPLKAAKALLARPEPTDRTEPFCWVIPGDDNADANGMLDASVDLTGEFTRPLYAHPRPEPEPRITREEAVRLLDNYYTSRDMRIRGTGLIPDLQRELDEDTEACLAAMLRSEPDRFDPFGDAQRAHEAEEMVSVLGMLDADQTACSGAIRVRAFWSLDRKLLISAYVTRDSITLMDDDCHVYEPSGNEQTFPDAPSAPTQKECRTCYGQGCEPHETDDGRLVQGPACRACKGAGFISSDAGNVT